MTKKPREPPADTTAADIFKTLFGDVPPSSNSLFSDNNPFRRKQNDDSVQQSGSKPEASEYHVNGQTEKERVAELKKRKRVKERKNESGDLDSVEEGRISPLPAIKKKKKERNSDSDFNLKAGNRENERENPSLGHESEKLSKKLKKKNQKSNSELEGVLMANNAKNPNVGSEIDNGLNSDAANSSGCSESKRKDGESKGKKRKRKRDDLEKEYEGKRYGAVPEEEKAENKMPHAGEKRKKMDNPEELMVSKEGFDDESKLLRTVFVGNLPLKIKKKALINVFRQFGEIDSVRIRSVPIMDTKAPRKAAIFKKRINEAADSVHAYVVFKSEQSAQASLAANMAEVAGRHIRVDRACPPRKKMKGDDVPLYDNKRTVFVGNLPFDVKDEEIYHVFNSMKQMESSIEAIRVVRHHHTSLGKGIAYILFKTKELAKLAVRKQNFKLRDRDLRLSPATSQATTPSKRRNPSSGQRDDGSRTKKFDSGARDSNPRTKTKSEISYQGLRASKSGRQKKAPSRALKPAATISKKRDGGRRKVHTTKRPAVAARKAAALAGGGSSKQAGKKRKVESRTPPSFRRNKKMKKLA